MKKYTKILSCLVAGAFFLTSCNLNEDPKEYKDVVVADGVLILNEGSFFNKINGSMDFLGYLSNSVERGIFANVNGRALGGTPNHAIVCGSKMYITTTEENRVEVVDAATLKAYNPIEMTAPRELCTDGKFVYVSSYTGEVSKVDTASLTVMAKSEKIGANLEGIAHRKGSIYVCNAWNNDYTYNTNLVKLNAETLAKEKDVTVVANPNQLIADGDKLFLASWGNYADVPATIQQIDLSDNVTNLTSGTHMAYANDYLYLIKSSYDEAYNEVNSYTVFNLTTKEETPFISGRDIDSPCTI
ncbi:MAG: hypothetical protein IJ605_03640, partial [Prevotella sp.]|nr:hypothetical protein [Prevotella sp.]